MSDSAASSPPVCLLGLHETLAGDWLLLPSVSSTAVRYRPGTGSLLEFRLMASLLFPNIAMRALPVEGCDLDSGSRWWSRDRHNEDRSAQAASAGDYVFRHSHGTGPSHLRLDPGLGGTAERLGMTDLQSEMSKLKIQFQKNASARTQRVMELANLGSPALGFHVATEGDPVAVWSSLSGVSIAGCRSPRGRPLAQGLFVASPGWCYCSRAYRSTAISGLAIRDPAGGCGSVELRRLSRKLDVSNAAIEAGELGETLERCATRNSCIVSGNNES